MPATTLIASEDGWVSQLHPDDNFITDRNGLTIGHAGTSASHNICRAWIKFDLSSLVGCTINSAVLSLADYTGYFYDTIHIFGCTNNNWNENTITWNTAPDSDVGNIMLGYFQRDGDPGVEMTQIFNISVTSAIASSLSSGKVSFRLDADDGGAYNRISTHRYVQSPMYSSLYVEYTAGSVPIPKTGFFNLLARR